MTGAEMTALFRRQLEESKADVILGRALSVMPMGNTFGVAVGSDFYMCSALIIAAGITREKLYPGEGEFLGRGVSYCATCDAPLYRGRTAAVIGYSPREEAEAAFLAGVCSKVLYFPMYKEQTDLPETVEVIRETPGEILKKEAGLAVKTEAGEYPADGVFVLREAVAPGQLVPGLETEGPHVTVNRRMETNIPGVFACGDLVGTPYQYVKAAGEGNIAAISAAAYIDRVNKEKGE
jgi:thioredoxin reductase (NADPH)